MLLIPADVAAAPLDFFCAAPLAHYGQLRQKLAGPTYRLSGEMHPVTLEDIPDPSRPVPIEAHTLRFAEASISSETSSLSVSLTVMPRYEVDGRGDRLADVYVQFQRDADGVAVPEYRDLGTVASRGVWDRLPFSIVAHSDRVTIEAGGRRTEIPLALGPGATVELSCIGGTYNFMHMDWGDGPAAGASPGGR